MHVDRSGQAHDTVDHGPAEQLLPARACRRSEHDLGGVLRSGEVDQRRGDVVAGHLAVLAAELLEQPALLGDGLCRLLVAPGRESGVGDDVDADQLALRPLGDACRAADEVIRPGRPGQGDHDAFARLPRAGDAVALAIVLEGVVDAVGDPEQGQLAQRRQVARPEVVGEGGVDLLRAVDVAVGQAAAQRLGRHVDELDLVGDAHGVVRDRLPLADARDPLDDVVQRFEVLDVDGRDDVDAGVEQLVDVRPALLVARTRRIAVGQLVDEDEVGMAAQDGVHVHLGELAAAVLDRPARHDLEVADLIGGALAAVCLDESDDDIGAALAAAASLVEHGERLADARRRPQVDPQGSSPAARSRAHCVVEGEVQSEHVDARVPEDAEWAILRVRLDESEHVARVHAPLGGDARRLERGVAHGDVRIET